MLWEASGHRVILLKEFGKLSELPAEIRAVSRLIADFGEVSRLLAVLGKQADSGLNSVEDSCMNS